MHSESFLKLVKESQTRIREITIDKLNEIITTKNKLNIIDVREKDEWEKGFIPSAIYLSKGILERDIEKIIPDKNAFVVLYCGGGYRSALAADNLQKMGYTNIHSLIGGYSAWRKHADNSKEINEEK